jgi:integrase
MTLHRGLPTTLRRPLAEVLAHTGLTWMADAGVPLQVLRKIAGHGSLSTTQRYLNPDHRSVELAGAALNAHLLGGRTASGPQTAPATASADSALTP